MRNKPISQETINKKIDTCEWAIRAYNIPVCRALASPCTRVIDKGLCPMLIEFFSGSIEEKE